MSTFVNNDVSSGATIFASDHNQQGSRIAAVLNGGIDNANINASAAIATSKLADDAGITTAKIADNAVSASKLATSAITLGYAQITSSFNLTASQNVQTLVTGLSTTVTIPAGGRRIKITVYVSSVSVATAGDFFDIQIWDGAVTSGTLLQKAVGTNSVNSGFTPICIVYSATPAPGSKTYNVSVSNDSGARNVFVNASSTSPAFILVEAI